MTKSARFLSVFILNAVIVGAIIFLQFLIFSFLPSIDPATPVSERRATAINVIGGKSVVLIAELAIGLLIGFFIHKRAFVLPLKINILILAIDFIIVLASLLFFCFDYINKFI
jgi:hypothetical protein